MTIVHVREAVLADLETIVKFNQALAIESEHRVLDVTILRPGVRMALERRDLCRYFVAEMEGHAVGQTMVTYELSDWRGGVIWWIQSVYVTPERRRAGVFSALFRAIEAQARAAKEVRGLRLYVLEENVAAVRTYERLGMALSDYRVCELDWSEAVRPARTV